MKEVWEKKCLSTGLYNHPYLKNRAEPLPQKIWHSKHY